MKNENVTVILRDNISGALHGTTSTSAGAGWFEAGQKNIVVQGLDSDQEGKPTARDAC